MHLAKAIGYIILCYSGSIVLVDLAAVLVVTILPSPGARRWGGYPGFGSTALYYAVWLVAGCFAGSFYWAYSSEVTRKNVFIHNNPSFIFLAACILSAGLIVIFFLAGEMLNPRYNFNNDYYVPGHRNMTYTFFGAFLLMCLILLRTVKKK